MCLVFSLLPPSYLTIPLDAVWASFWGMLFRKFFWDFIGGILRNPGGIQSVRLPLLILSLVDTPFSQTRPQSSCVHHRHCQDAHCPNYHHGLGLHHSCPRIPLPPRQGVAHPS